MTTPDKCPKCGAEEFKKMVVGTHYDCGTFRCVFNGKLARTLECHENQQVNADTLLQQVHTMLGESLSVLSPATDPDNVRMQTWRALYLQIGKYLKEATP